MVTVIKKCVAVFKSRSQVMEFQEIMAKQGVPCKIISTPKEAHVGCGVSLEFQPSKLEIAKILVNKGRFNSFYGFFLIEKRGTHTATVRI